MTVTEALELARLQGIEVTLDGDDLVLKAEAAPPPGLLAILGPRQVGHHSRNAPARREGRVERRAIVRWVSDHFASSPPGVCAHCGGGARLEDPFVVLLFVGKRPGRRCTRIRHSTWLAERGEAGALRSAGIIAQRRLGPPRPHSTQQVSDRVHVSNCPGEKDNGQATTSPRKSRCQDRYIIQASL